MAAFAGALPGGLLGWDESAYASLGRSVLDGRGFALGGQPWTFHPPGMALLEAASMGLSGHRDDVGARLGPLAAAGLLLLLVGGAATRLWGARAGLAAVALLAGTVQMGRSTLVVLAEMPMALCLTAAVLAFHDGLHRRPASFLWAWLLFALAVLFRYEALLFLGAAALQLALAREVPREARLAPLVALAALAPYLLGVALCSGHPLSGVLDNFRVAAAWPGSHGPWWTYLRELPFLGSPALLLAAATGAGVAAVRRDRAALACLGAALVVLGAMSLLLAQKEPRRILAVLPFLALLGAYGIEAVLQAAGRGLRGVLVGLLVAALLARSAVAALDHCHRTVLERRPAELEATWRLLRTLAREERPEAVVMAASPPIAEWYADREAVPFPAGDLAFVLRRVDRVLLLEPPAPQDAAVRALARPDPEGTRRVSDQRDVPARALARRVPRPPRPGSAP